MDSPNSYYAADKDALSNSKRLLWKRDPEKYVEQYMYEGRRFTNKAMAYGTKVHDAIETGESTGDIHIDLLVSDLPKFPDGLDSKEIVIETEIKLKGEVTPLIGKIDRLKTDYTAFKDWKTGKTKWTQHKVDEDDQITFYCMLIWIQKKTIPNDIEIVWIPTEEDERGELKVTGDVVRFHTTRTMGKILNMMVECRKVWKEITARYEQELLK